MNEGEGRELIGREVVALNRALIERLGPVVGRAWGRCTESSVLRVRAGGG